MNAIILDYDMTIADSSPLEPYRKSRNWQYVFANLSKITLYDGMKELLLQARSKQYLLAIVTSSPSEYCKKSISHLGIDMLFTTIVGYHDAARRKPYPDPVNLALSKLGCQPGRCFGLGDLPDDISAYNRAGIKSVACRWGNDRVDFTTSKPHLVVDTPLKMIAYL